MIVGHIAVAFLAKGVEPRIRLDAAVAAALGLDLLWPIFLILGIESVRVNPGDTAFTNLAFDSYPWSHSLLMVLGWSALAATVARRVTGSWRLGAVLGVLVVSHWVLDLVTHRPDLPLWPGGMVVGLGLWQSIAGTILIEGGLFASATWLYVSGSSARDGVGRWGLVALVAFTTILWITQPWSPPPPSATAVAWGTTLIWLLPLWAGWVERHRVAT